MEISMRLIVVHVSLVCLLMSATTADGSPIFPGDDPGSFYDLTLSVESSMSLVPGTVGFLNARIFNTGTLPISFKPYDASNPVGGFGWNFDDPGFAIGWF